MKQKIEGECEIERKEKKKEIRKDRKRDFDFEILIAAKKYIWKLA